MVVPLPPPALTKSYVTPVLPPFTAERAQNGGQEEELDDREVEKEIIADPEVFIVSRSQLTNKTTRKIGTTAKTND